MFVEFIGLPGSGKSTLIDKTVRSSADMERPAVKLGQLAQLRVADLKTQPGYLRRRPDRSWFFGTFSFAHKHPELFRIVFENTLLNAPGRLDFLDLLAQYHFAHQADDTVGPILVDEGLLHRGAAAFLYENAYATLESYLSLMPRIDVVVLLEMDTTTAIARCKQRPKGLPKLYKKFSDDKLVSAYETLKGLHQTCLDHQVQAGAKLIRLDATASVETNAKTLLAELSGLDIQGAPEGAERG